MTSAPASPIPSSIEKLSRDPALIRMSEVITALEGPIAPMVCVGHEAAVPDLCERTGFCTVHGLWQRVRDAVVAALDGMTLAELAAPRVGHPVHADPILVAVRPLTHRPAKESIAQP